MPGGNPEIYGKGAAYHGEIPEPMLEKCWYKLPEDMREIIEKFGEYCK